MKKAKRKPAKKTSIEQRLTRLEHIVATIIRSRTPDDRKGTTEERINRKMRALGQAIQRQAPTVTKVYRSMQWHLRDGTGYGRPPYAIDNSTGNLRPPNVS